MAAETRKQSTDPTPKRRAKAKPPDARPADDTESSPAMTVTLSERDLANAHDLMAALSLENTDESVSTALNVAARLARMLKTPGSRLYLRKSDGTVQGIALVRPRATDA